MVCGEPGRMRDLLGQTLLLFIWVLLLSYVAAFSSSARHQHYDERHDESVNKVLTQFASGGRQASVVLPTGWGKTLMALQVIQKMASESLQTSNENMSNAEPIRTVVYVTPFLKLADQTLEHLEKHKVLSSTGIPYETMVVASDTNRPERHTTSPEVIAAFLQEGKESQDLRLLVSTTMSLRRVAEAISLMGGQQSACIDLAIFDEAHTMAGISKYFGFGLYDRELPVRYRLFQTATPRIFNPTIQQRSIRNAKITEDGVYKLIVSKDDGIERTDIRSFDNTTLFGPIVQRKTYQDAVQQGVTVPLTLCVVSKQELLSLIPQVGDNIQKAWTPELFRPLALQAAFAKYNISHGVSFHNSIERARRFVEYGKTVWGGDIFAAHVSGRMHRKEQEQILQIAKLAPKSVVANSRLLSLGVDESCWDMVFIADPIMSPERIKQAIGRASRTAPNKCRGYVLLPLAFDEDGEDSSSNAFKMMATTFRLIFDDDPDLRRDIAYVTDEEAKLGRSLELSEYPESLRQSIDFPDSLTVDVQLDIMQRLIVEVTARDLDPWEIKFSRVAELMKTCKTLPAKEADWLYKQRKLKKRGRLTPDQIQKMEAAGLEWDPLEERFRRNVELLRNFKQREGHCLVPKTHVEDGVKLGEWILGVRSKRENLSHHRKEELDNLGMIWDHDEYIWKRKYGILKRFIRQTGNWPTSDILEDGMRITPAWITMLRSKKREGKLDSRKVRQLEDLGISWDPLGDTWKRNCNALAAFMDREGHSRVPYDHMEGDIALGKWFSYARRRKAQGKLTPDQIHRLENALEHLNTM